MAAAGDAAPAVALQAVAAAVAAVGPDPLEQARATVAALNAQKRTAAAELKKAERKRQRLLDKVAGLPDQDLLQALALRGQANNMYAAGRRRTSSSGKTPRSWRGCARW